MKVNKKLTQVVAGTVSASILASSCTPSLVIPSPINDEKPIYRIGANQDLGEIAIPINVNIDTQDVKFIALIQKLADDIIANPSVAQLFIDNPNAYLQQLGYDGEVSFSDGTFNLILALADPQINEAIKNNDIKLFYSLCKQKKLLNLQAELFSKFSDEELNKVIQHLGLKTNATAIRQGDQVF